MEDSTYVPDINITDPVSRSPLPVSILVLTGISSSLSIAGALIIFLSFFIIENSIRNQTRWLLLYLTIADFLNCSGNLIGMFRYIFTYYGRTEVVSDCLHSSSACVVQSFITTFSSMASFFWTIAIALHLSTSIRRDKVYMDKFKVKVFCHTICWGIPLSITIAAVSKSALGESFSVGSGPWCWIRDCLEPPWPNIWMTITGKGWEILMYILSILFFMDFKWSLHRQQVNQNEIEDVSSNTSDIRSEDKNYVWLPLVLYLMRAWGTIRFFMALARTNGSVYDMPTFQAADDVILYFQSVGDSSQAFCNCVLFCFLDKKVRADLVRRLKCCKNINNINDERAPLYRSEDEEKLNASINYRNQQYGLNQPQ